VLHIKCNRPLSSVLYCSSKKQFVNVDNTIFWHSGQVLLGFQHRLRGPGPKIHATTYINGMQQDYTRFQFSQLWSTAIRWYPHTMQQVTSSCHSLPWQKGSHKFKGLHKATSEIVFVFVFLHFLTRIVTQLLQCNINQMHICYNLILHSIFYMFWAWKAHHQEDSCKNTGIMVQYISMYTVYGESSMCG